MIDRLDFTKVRLDFRNGRLGFTKGRLDFTKGRLDLSMVCLVYSLSQNPISVVFKMCILNELELRNRICLLFFFYFNLKLKYVI